jgi:hypothetical protein
MARLLRAGWRYRKNDTCPGKQDSGTEEASRFGEK